MTANWILRITYTRTHGNMGSTQNIDVEELRHALVHLLGRVGLPCPEQGLTVKQTLSRSGATGFILIAVSGAETFVDQAIGCSTSRERTSLSGIWALSSRHAMQLLQYAAVSMPVTISKRA